MLYAKSLMAFLESKIFYRSLALSSILESAKVLHVVFIFESLDYFYANCNYFVLSILNKMSKSVFVYSFLIYKWGYYSREGIITVGSGGQFFSLIAYFIFFYF